MRDRTIIKNLDKCGVSYKSALDDNQQGKAMKFMFLFNQIKPKGKVAQFLDEYRRIENGYKVQRETMFSDEQLIEMREMRSEGLSFEYIANQFGVVPSTIQTYCQGVAI